MTDDYKPRDDEIDLIHYLDLKASLAGRNDGGPSPPFDVNTGPRQPKTQKGNNTPAGMVLVPPSSSVSPKEIE